MTKIKICGIKTVTDALAAMDAGADLIGFNFYPKSPRYVEVGQMPRHHVCDAKVWTYHLRWCFRQFLG